MRTTMRVSSHPDSKAITGKIRMSPPIIPFTMQRIAMGPEICSPSSSILSYYNWFKIVSNHWNLEKKVSSDISSTNLHNTLNHDGQAHTYHEGHCNQLTPSPFLWYHSSFTLTHFSRWSSEHLLLVLFFSLLAFCHHVLLKLLLRLNRSCNFWFFLFFVFFNHLKIMDILRRLLRKVLLMIFFCMIWLHEAALDMNCYWEEINKEKS